MYTNQPLCPRRPGSPLKVLTLGRISTTHQDMAMIEAQHAEVQRVLSAIYDGKVELVKLGEQASGEAVFRETFVDAINLIGMDEFDLAILFDLSKASRNQQFMWFFMNTCVDHGTRFISIGDNIDTADPTWQTAAGAAALVHGTHIQQTRHRVAAKAVVAFDNGGMVIKIPYGYRKVPKEEALSAQNGSQGLRIAKTPEATAIIREMRDRVLRGDTYEEVARWLNDTNTPTGPYSTRSTWDGKRVIAYLRNPLLHGEREFGRYHIERKLTTGKTVRRWDPTPRTMTYPELAHLSVEEHTELLAEMQRRVGANPRKRRAKVGPRARARSQTYFPGQTMTCGVCGSVFYWGGNKGLKCSKCGDPDRGGCWNHIQVGPETARRKIGRALLHELQARPDAKAAMIQAVLAECDRLRGREGRQVDQIDAQMKSLQADADNLATEIGKRGGTETLFRHLKDAEEKLKDLAGQRKRAEAAFAAHPMAVSARDIEARFPEILAYLMANSYEFAELLRRVIPAFTILPMQAVDTGKPVARAHVTFSFAAMLQSRQPKSYQPQPGDFSVNLDLFDPPAHVQCLLPAIRLHEEHPDWSCEKIADLIGAKRWDVRQALKLHALMQSRGVFEPYVPIIDYHSVSRWRMQNSRMPRWDQAK